MAGETDSDVVQALMKQLPVFEGNIPFLYLDTTGNVTTGIGHMIPTQTAACAIPFVDRVSGAAAARPAIIAAYKQVKAAPMGLVANAYQKYTTLNLLSGWAEQDAAARLASEFLPALKALYITYDTFPIAARVALLDMAYNLGVGKPSTLTQPATGLSEYLHLKAYCEASLWTQAAQQCHRRGIPDHRNQWASQQFASAVI